MSSVCTQHSSPAVGPSVMAHAAHVLIESGMRVEDVAAALGATADEVLDLSVDHLLRIHGASVALPGREAGL